MNFATADLCDQYEDQLGQSIQVAEPIFRSYGAKKRFSGEIVTLKLFEDNSLVRTALGQAGNGKVLVIDGGGSLRCALVGDQLAVLAHQNGWEGIIVHGCIRDSEAINGIDLGVRALNTHPQKSIKKGIGERDLTVSFAGVRFVPGQWIYADADGIVVSPHPLTSD